MAVTASLVKELREKSGAGMMDCKKALTETGGYLDAAVDWLRKRGLAAAAKKSSRIAADGLVGVVVNANKGAILEVNAETDFLARNDVFKNFVATVTNLVLQHGEDIENLNNTTYPGTTHTVAEQLANNVAIIGEKISLRRAKILSVSGGIVVSYVHNAVQPGLGKIGVLVALDSIGDNARLYDIGKQIAMHVAATAPMCLSIEDLDGEVIKRERTILTEQVRPIHNREDITAKIIEGRMQKFYQDVVLLEQKFIMNGEIQISKFLESATEIVGAAVRLTSFARIQLGEGIERKEASFATQVAASTPS
ncbi:translation elongation factor Ts [Candidatus Endolissoclinum faulkneri L5]|uniref:Elongation factor Ts n=1 Tax=Candidatus Endolissoclinum faulkneri L5 TaxID=1401328 RepID=V9TVH7_9PROT|nr:translation elongation factor Ts [Candidatus Endolissoclinum faulkneri]AHC73678.1 translation elongation factor Ts [Candidatus Endolissoclinum faulkneri L5]